MTATSTLALLPLMVLAATIALTLLTAAFYRHHAAVLIVTLAGLVVAFGTLTIEPAAASIPVTQLLVIDGYARFFMGLIFASSFAVALLAYRYLSREAVPEEFYVLLLLATLGSAVLVSANHFASFFLGLEILSVSLYALIAYTRARSISVEAGVKYLILAATSAAFLLFGMALIYAETGTMEFSRLISSAPVQQAARDPLLLTGLGMTIVGIGYKLAWVPFHLWTPDVYEGAPAPVTAFVATVSKGAMFALLLRYFTAVNVHSYSALLLVFTIIAIASMVFGNLLALLQKNVKRILAYSSIAHLGYLLVAFLASGALAITAVAFYLVVYFVTTMGAFAVVTVLSKEDRDADRLEDYRGLFSSHPWLAGIFTAMLLSLAGVPLTAGFIGKFYLVAAGVGSALWLLVIVLVVTSAVGLFYYLRVVIVMYSPPAEEAKMVISAPYLSLGGGIVLGALTILLIWLGVYPTSLLQIIEAAVHF